MPGVKIARVDLSVLAADLAGLVTLDDAALALGFVQLVAGR